ncbi:Nuclear transcription factor Y subunit B-5 [Linum perenne]
MKQILPPNAKVSKEAKETMQECVSEFISFVTSEASEEKCRKERRKTLNGDDVCWAMGSLGFDDYVAPLRHFLHRYREVEGDRATSQGSGGGGGGVEGGGGNFDDSGPHRQRYEHTNQGGGGGEAANLLKFDGN